MKGLFQIIGSDIHLEPDKGYIYKDLNQKELKRAEEICERWLIPHSSDIDYSPLINNLNVIYDRLEKMEFGITVREFRDRITQVPIDFTKSEEVSGAIVMFGSLFMSLQYYGCVKEIDGSFLFALSYMLIDHTLDNNDISDEDKIKTMVEIYKFISDNNISDKDISDKIPDNNNYILRVTSEKYRELIERVPSCRKYFIDLFQSEIKGVIIQKNNNLSRKIYLDMAMEKGGKTGVAMASILGLLDPDVMKDSYNLSAALQLVDDLADIEIDKKEDIYTLARYDYDRGNLDEYIYTVIVMIDRLPSVYNFFKIVLMLLTMLGIHDHKNSISPDLLTILERFIPYDKKSNKETLTEWFINKIYSYIHTK